MLSIIFLCDVSTSGRPLLLRHLTFSHEAALQSQKNRKNIASDSRRYEWPHGKCSAWQSKVGYESPSVSLTQSLRKRCTCVFCVCVWECVTVFFSLLMSYGLNHIWDDSRIMAWPCNTLGESWVSLLLVCAGGFRSVCASGKCHQGW